MTEEKRLSKVYVLLDGDRIIRCEGGYTTPDDLTGWTEIDEGTGDRYNLCQTHYFGGELHTPDGIPRWKLVEDATAPFGVRPVLRTEDELAADRAAIPAPPPTEAERLRADVDYLAVMAGVTL